MCLTESDLIATAQYFLVLSKNKAVKVQKND